MRDLADVSVRLPPKKPSFLKQPATYSRLVATVPSVWSAIAQGYLQFRLFSVSISTTRLLHYALNVKHDVGMSIHRQCCRRGIKPPFFPFLPRTSSSQQPIISHRHASCASPTPPDYCSTSDSSPCLHTNARTHPPLETATETEIIQPLVCLRPASLSCTLLYNLE